MRTFQRTLLAGAVALALATPAVAQFTNAIFFGDSLLDAGSFKSVVPPGTGLFTTNPGPIWVTPFGQNLGFSVSPANAGRHRLCVWRSARGAVAGLSADPADRERRSDRHADLRNFSRRAPLIQPPFTRSTAAGTTSSRSSTALQAGTISQAAAQANIALAATQLATQIAVLHAAGAQYIIVWNVPDIGNTPYGRSVGPAGAAQLTATSQLYNSTLFAALNATGVPTIRFNAFGLLNEISANPGLYGFSNATLRACGTTSSFLCTPANLVTPNAAQTFVFADDVHPTTAAMRSSRRRSLR